MKLLKSLLAFLTIFYSQKKKKKKMPANKISTKAILLVLCFQSHQYIEESLKPQCNISMRHRI